MNARTTRTMSRQRYNRRFFFRVGKFWIVINRIEENISSMRQEERTIRKTNMSLHLSLSLFFISVHEQCEISTF